MTRFARARGSKASNEKAPEDGTPWEVMKDQLLHAKKESEVGKKRQEAEKQRIENYEHFLNEQKVQKRKATWCDFPEVDQTKRLAINATQTGPQPTKKKKKNKEKTEYQLKPTESVNTGDAEPIDVEPIPFVNETKKIKRKNKQESVSQPQEQIKAGLPQASEQKPAKKRKKNKNKEHSSESNTPDVSNLTPEVANGDLNSVANVSKKQKKTNKKNRNKSKQNDLNPTEDSLISQSTDVAESNHNKISIINKHNKIKALKKKNDKKLVDGKPVRRKEINDNSFQLIINGKEVELVRFDGFPVMKKDAERLALLKGNMIKKGIPKSEVQRTMKLERRRAEKALARVKRDVCYNCRKGGHNLSDCPELKSKIPGVGAAEGVCFKCGSTEHRQFECKVQRDKEFRFATCFICKEPGHIARQCPDNPKGLYPNGGSCKLCGDVTHLRKDCPTVNDKKEETSVKLDTLESTVNIEDIRQPLVTQGSEEMSKKPKKIKF